MSKIPVDKMKQCITQVLSVEKRGKERKFVETVDLQIGLKDYDTNKDKYYKKLKSKAFFWNCQTSQYPKTKN